MQIDATSASVTTAAHSTNRTFTLQNQQIQIDAWRLGNWTQSFSAGTLQPSSPSSASATRLASGSLSTASPSYWAVTTVSGCAESSPCLIITASFIAGSQSASLSWASGGAGSSYNVYRSASGNNWKSASLLTNTTLLAFTDNGTAGSPCVPPPLFPYDFGVASAGSNIVRARTRSNNTLEITTASAADSLAFGSNLVAACAYSGYGATAIAYGASTVDVFYADRDGITLKGIRSADNAISFGAASTIATVPTQQINAMLRLAAPASNILFWSDSSGSSTIVSYSVFSGGVWSSACNWDLDGFSMGLANGLPVFGSASNTYYSTLSAVELAANDYLLCFYASNPMGAVDSGIWTLRVRNVNSASAIWNDPQPIFVNIVPPNAGNPTQGARLYCGFPEIQKVGSEYWITALEISTYAGVNTVHLAYWRSADGVHWSDRDYLAGTDFGISGLGFSINDLIYGKLLISSNRTYLFGYDKIYRTPSTSLVGITNSSLVKDITPDLDHWSLNLPQAGGVAQGTLLVNNPNSTYTGSSILVKGARVVMQAGYQVASGANALVKLLTGIIDEVEQSTLPDFSGLSVTIRDYIDNLAEWVVDIFYEYFSGFQFALGMTAFSGQTPFTTAGFKDLTSLQKVTGTFFTNNGILHPGVLDVNDSAPNNMSILNLGAKSSDFICETLLYEDTSFTNSQFGIAPRVYDDQNFYEAVYNKTASTFTLEQAVPACAGVVPNVTFSIAVSSAACTLNVNNPYWFRVQSHHKRLQAYYSNAASSGATARKTWTKVLDTTSGFPTTQGYVGLVGKGNLTTAQPVGQTSQVTGFNSVDYWAALNDNSAINLGYRFDYIMRVTAPTSGILRGISVLLGRITYGTLLPPDVIIELCLDDGTGAKPADLSVGSNIVFSTTIGSASIPLEQAATPWTNVPVTSSVLVTGGQYYWLHVAPVSNITPSLFSNTQRVEIGWYPTGNSIYPCKWTYSSIYNPTGWAGTNPNWLSLSQLTLGYVTVPSDASLDVAMSAALNTAGPLFYALNFASGEIPKTIEYIATDIAAKGYMLTTAADNRFNDTFDSLSQGADGSGSTWASGSSGTWSVSASKLNGQGTSASWGFMRSNSSCGTFGDGIYEYDLTLVTASAAGGVGFRASGDAASSLTGYLISFERVVTETSSAFDSVVLYYVNAGSPFKYYSSPATVRFPNNGQFHVTVSIQSGYYTVWLNNVLVANFFDGKITADGQLFVGAFGLAGGTQIQVDNLRAPDLWMTKKYFAITKDNNLKSALDSLCGSLNRISYFARYDGALRISQWIGRTVQDTYQSTLIETHKKDSNRYWFTHLQSAGGQAADRFASASLLGTMGRRYRHSNYTDAFTDYQAYVDGGPEIRAGEEMSAQYEMKSGAVPAIEREDRITIINNQVGLGDSTSADYIVNDIDLEFQSGEQPIFDQTVGLRKFVS